MSQRERILEMQRMITDELRQAVRKIEGPKPRDLARYESTYKRELARPKRVSSKSNLIRRIQKADIILGGDFHPSSQSQRLHLRLMRELVPGSRPIVLCVEAVESNRQPVLDLWLKGRISEKTFLKRTRYEKNWGFPWENYKAIFDFARYHHVPVYGINAPRSFLRERDRHAAKLITAIRRDHPSAIIYVIYGDLHLAESHLPKALRDQLGHKTDIVKIFNNPEVGFWKLADRGLEDDVDVLKMAEHSYCVVNSPPWLPWQSYLNYLEARLDPENRMEIAETIFRILHLISRLFDAPMRWPDFHVVYHHDRSHLKRLLPSRQFQHVQRWLDWNQSFFIPKPAIFVLRSSDANTLTSLAGQYFQAKLASRTNLPTKFPHDFSLWVWCEASGFFISKVFNNRRKAQILKDIKITAAASQIMFLHQISLNKKVRWPRAPWQDYVNAGQLLGRLLGQRLFVGFKQGIISNAEVTQFLATNPTKLHRLFKEGLYRKLRRMHVNDVASDRL